MPMKRGELSPRLEGGIGVESVGLEHLTMWWLLATKESDNTEELIHADGAPAISVLESREES